MGQVAGGGIVVGSVGRGPVRFAKSHWAGFPLLFNNKINEWKFIVFVRKCPHCCFSMSFNLFFNSLKTNIPYPLICIQWTGVWIERHINFIQLNIQLNFLFLAVYLYAAKSYVLENSCVDSYTHLVFLPLQRSRSAKSLPSKYHS